MHRSLGLFVAGLLACAGCTGSREQTVKYGAGKPETPPPVAVAKKGKEAPKRKPKAETILALAVLKETDADRVEDPARQMKVRDEARFYFREALKIDPKCREAHQGLARIFTKMGDYDKAFETYEQALAQYPKEAELWYDLGMCHNQRKRWDKSADCLQKALDLDPENRRYMQTLGFTLARAGRPEESLPHLRLSMGEALAHYNLARMMQHVGQPETCRRHLLLALQADPNLGAAREMLNGLTGEAANPVIPAGGTQEY